MNDANTNDAVEELQRLLLEWEDGSINDAGVQRIRQILLSVPESRKHFAKFQSLSAALAIDNVESPVASRTHRPKNNEGTQKPPSSRGYFWPAIAAAFLACVLGVRLAYLEFAPKNQLAVQSDSIANTEQTSRGIALVTKLVDVRWTDNQSKYEVGDALSPGVLTIESGYMQVDFFCGATVVIEGPAELDLESSMLAKVTSGRLRVQVPPAARGFSLIADDFKVVDLGTEFGLSVSDKGASVHVFDGEVELHRPASKVQLLTTGQTVNRKGDGQLQSVKLEPENYIDIADLESREQGQQVEHFRRWQDWSRRLRPDSRLIAYYGFEQKGGWQRKLLSSRVNKNGDGTPELDGAIVGARRLAGRWPDKSALEFKRPGDRVRVQIPGEFGSLTFACWVKIDSLDRMYNSLFLTDNYDRGEPHWQILDTGQLFFSVRPSVDPHQTVLSPPFWKPAMSGKWLHLATTYDVAQKQVTHYLNGQTLHTESISDDKLVRKTRLGTASIGNWSLPTKPDADFAIRNLNGSIDEFAIFAAALEHAEIKSMYENGKP